MLTFSDSDRPTSPAMSSPTISSASSDFELVSAIDALAIGSQDIEPVGSSSAPSGDVPPFPASSAASVPRPPTVRHDSFNSDGSFEIIVMPPASVISASSSSSLAPSDSVSMPPRMKTYMKRHGRREAGSGSDSDDEHFQFAARPLAAASGRDEVSTRRASRRRPPPPHLTRRTTDDSSSSSDSTERPSPSALRPGSIVSAAEAQSFIDSFLADTESVISNSANKLRLWQALCVELGLVQLEDSIAIADLPSSPSTLSSPYPSPPPMDGTTTPPSGRSTPTQSNPRPLPALPQSLTAARKLLKDTAHVNLRDYLAARTDPARHAAAAGAGEAAGKYRDLVYPSASAMKRATLKERKVLALEEVKKEWLEPLLKDFGFKRARVAT